MNTHANALSCDNDELHDGSLSSPDEDNPSRLEPRPVANQRPTEGV
jgi:hypothetical protein